MSASIMLRNSSMPCMSARSRCSTKPSAHMCGPRRFVRMQPFAPQFIRKQSSPDATPNAQRARAFRRDPFVAMAPFCSPAFVGRLEQYMNELQNELQGEFETIGKNAARDCNDWSGTSSGASEGRLSLDISEDEIAYWLKVDVPGITREDIQLKVTDDRLLVISAERKPETADDDSTASKDGFVRKERRFGKFGRSLRLPKNVDVAGITAEAKDGVMTVSLPKNPEQAPREQQIEIN